MADDVERLPSSLQESVLAALCFNVPHGAAIAAQVLPDNFDSVYRDFASRIINYRRRYGRPPGPNHIEDIAHQSTYGRENSPVVKHLVPTLLAERDSLNAEYAASRVQDFIRRQTYKGALVEATDRYEQDDENLLTDLERIFHKALSSRQNTLEAGTFLTDVKAMSGLNRRREFMPLGIPVLDSMGIGPSPKELLLYIGPKGSGKSWFCVHVGKQAILQRQKVCHVSLEMSEEKVALRYFQALFAVSDNSGKENQTVLKFDKVLKDRLIDFETKRVSPKEIEYADAKTGEIKKQKLYLGAPNLKTILRSKMKGYGLRLANLVIKDFPTSQLTVEQLEAYLDYLESVERFVPNILIVDYPKLMRTEKRQDLRISLGRNVEELRGLGVRRNMAVVVPHQGTRKTIKARRTRSSDAGEDISVVQTADVVLAFSRTEAEERLGLGRLSVEHARDSRGSIMLLLTQSYGSGQYVLDSAIMQRAYWDRLKEVSGEDDPEED